MPTSPEPEIAQLFLAAPAAPEVPELEPILNYELEAQEYLQEIFQYEENVDAHRSDAERTHTKMLEAEEASAVRHLGSCHEIRLLQDRIHALQLTLEQSETREISVRCETAEQGARIESNALLHTQRIYANFRREPAQYEQHVAEEAANTRGVWESQARERCTTADQRAAVCEQKAFENLDLAQRRAAEQHEDRLRCDSLVQSA